MKTEYLFARLERMPMVKAVVPFAVGILFAAYYTLPPWLLIGGLLLCSAAALLFRSALYTAILLFSFGVVAAQLRDASGSVPQNIRTDFDLTILTPPAQREGYTSTTALVGAWRNPASGRWHTAADKIVLWIDTTLRLVAGERIICSGRLKPLCSRHESYRRLMVRRGYAGSVWLSQRQLLEQSPGNTSSLHLVAIERLNRLPLSSNARALCNAMAVGDKSILTQELRSAYSRSGTSHLLAVSGLHVGIVFALVNLLLWGLPALLPRWGHLVRNIVAIALIWLYAAVADFSPSVVRAALMFSALQFSLASASVYIGMNILAATAFCMLLFNPAYLFDISFQLSFTAVAAILAWGVPLCRRLRTKRWYIDLLAATLIISAVSTLATAPLVSHTFGIISIAALVVNPAAIALAHIIVLGSVVWILLPVGIFAPVLGWLLNTTAQLQNGVVEAAAAHPWAAIDYTLSPEQTVACYAFFAAATIILWCLNPRKRVSLPR